MASQEAATAAAAATTQEQTQRATAQNAGVQESKAGEATAAHGGEGQEEEEGECGFCLYMKGGGCRDAFVAWEECVEAAEKGGADLVERCFEATANLKKCMDAHADYYAPILQAEQAVSDHADAAVATAAADDEERKNAAADDQREEESSKSPVVVVHDQTEEEEK